MAHPQVTLANAQVTYTDIFAPNYSVTGIRQDTGSGSPVLITGSYQGSDNKPQGLLYRGPIYPTDGSGYIFLTPVFPGHTVTSSIFYGPNTALFDPSIGAGNLRAVGSYKYSQPGGELDHGMMYQGSPSGAGTWTQIKVPDSMIGEGRKVANVIPHSTMGDLVVGDYDLDQLDSASAFIYDVKTGLYTLLKLVPLMTAYGIWQNGGPSSSFYTIAGGYKPDHGIDIGYLVDYDAISGIFSNLTKFSYNDDPGIFTHFEGITGFGSGNYSMAAETDAGAAFATIPRNSDGSFGQAQWVTVRNPATKTKGISTGNSVLENKLIGIYEPSTSNGIQSYVATVSP